MRNVTVGATNYTVAPAGEAVARAFVRNVTVGATNYTVGWPRRPEILSALCQPRIACQR